MIPILHAAASSISSIGPLSASQRIGSPPFAAATKPATTLSAEAPAEQRGRSRERRAVQFASDGDRFEASLPTPHRRGKPSPPSGAALLKDWRALRERLDGQLQALETISESLANPRDRDALRAAREQIDFSEIDAFAQTAAAQVNSAQNLAQQSRRWMRGIAKETGDLRAHLHLPSPDRAFDSKASVGCMAAQIRAFMSDLSLNYCDVPALTPDVETSDEEWVWLQSLSSAGAGHGPTAEPVAVA